MGKFQKLKENLPKSVTFADKITDVFRKRPHWSTFVNIVLHKYGFSAEKRPFFLTILDTLFTEKVVSVRKWITRSHRGHRRLNTKPNFQHAQILTKIGTLDNFWT